jgi:ABC-type multidrug transport system permease subunit
MTDSRNPLFLLARARLYEFVREPGVVFWVFVFPLLLAVALGIAFRSTPEELPVVGLADDAPAWLGEALENSGGVEVARVPAERLERSLRDGDVDVVAVGGGEGRDVEYRFDPSRPGARAARRAADDALQRALGRIDVARAADLEVEAPGQRYIDFVFPGLLGLNLMSTSLWGIGFALVWMRKRKLLKVLASTPMRRVDFLVSMFLSRAVFLGLEVGLLLGFGWLVFDVEVRGSIVAVFLLAFLGAAAFAALGLVIGSRVASTETANGWVNLVQLPMWLLSGTFFSYERFPEVMHPVIRVLPLTALNDALRAVVLDGDTLLDCGGQLLVIVVWAVAAFVTARVMFRWL